MAITSRNLTHFIVTTHTVTCDRCKRETVIDGEQSKSTIAEYLTRQGWFASEDEVICPQCTATFNWGRLQVEEGERWLEDIQM